MSTSTGSDESDYDEHWASWYCSLSGNKFFCDIDKSYIEDNFNLYGLKAFVPKDYNKAMDTILDRLGPEQETEEIARSAALLYGMIHARYIITSHGLESMHRKYLNKDFGECPRMLCRSQPVLPIGVADDPKQNIVKLFCPKCRDMYNCQPSQRHIDGAYFGTTFPNLFFMSFEDLVPEPAIEKFEPKVFGFRIHSSSKSLPKTSNGSADNVISSDKCAEGSRVHKRSLSDSMEPKSKSIGITENDEVVPKIVVVTKEEDNTLEINSAEEKHKSQRIC
jgi:casein kinase II subunit beta